MTKQYPLPLPHHEAMAADDFMITASNREAAAWVHAWPEWPAPCLLILGPSGSGKTHLLNLWLHHSKGAPISADTLNCATASTIAADHKIIAIDNIDQIAGHAEAEETLFHLYNLLRDEHGFLLLTATLPPAQWPAGLPDLRSRLLAAPVAAIGEPDDELLSMLLIKQFHDRQIEVGTEVITYLLPRMERSTAAIRTLVTTLDRASLAEGKGITVALVKRIMGKEPPLL